MMLIVLSESFINVSWCVGETELSRGSQDVHPGSFLPQFGIAKLLGEWKIQQLVGKTYPKY